MAPAMKRPRPASPAAAAAAAGATRWAWALPWPWCGCVEIATSPPAHIAVGNSTARKYCVGTGILLHAAPCASACGCDRDRRSVQSTRPKLRAPAVLRCCVALRCLALPCAASLTPRQPTRHGRLLQGRRLQGLSSPSCARRQSSQSHPLHQRPIPRSGLPVPSLPLLPLVTTPSGCLRALLHPRQQLHEPQRGLSYSHACRRGALPARRTTLCHALKEIRDCCLPSHLAHADWLPTLPFSTLTLYITHPRASLALLYGF